MSAGERPSSLDMYRSWRQILSFWRATLALSMAAAVSKLRVWGVSSPSCGLDVVLPVSERVGIEGLSKIHCWSSGTATLAMIQVFLLWW